MGEELKGALAMTGACVIWGLSPLYYALLSHIPPLEVLAHRSLWSLVAFLAVLAVQGRLAHLPAALARPRLAVLTGLAGLMISVNWGLYILSIQIGRTIEAALGYYIFPLVAVVIGWAVLGERLGRLRAAAIALAAAAVMVLVLGLGVAPWISLTLATTFGIYGLLKRWVVAGPVVSVTAEVLLLAPLAAGFLVFGGRHGWPVADYLLLAFSGVLTATPLMLFSFAARRASMATVGIVQYLNPTLQFLCASVFLGEVVTRWHGIALPLIWVALGLYSAAALRQRRPATTAGR